MKNKINLIFRIQCVCLALLAGTADAAFVTPSERTEIVWTEEDRALGIAKRDLYEDANGTHFAILLSRSETPHVHPQDLTAVLVKGRAVLHVEDKNYPLEAGDSAFIPAGTTHWAELEAGELCEVYAIYHK